MDAYVPAIFALLKYSVSVRSLSALGCRVWLTMLRFTRDETIASHLSAMVVSVLSVFTPGSAADVSGTHSALSAWTRNAGVLSPAFELLCIPFNPAHATCSPELRGSIRCEHAE